MSACVGFGGRPGRLYACAYPALWEVDGQPTCAFHAKVIEGLITDAGDEPLCWPPHRHRPKVHVPWPSGAALVEALRREWGLVPLPDSAGITSPP